MTTAVDTNVIVALWDRDEELNSAAQSALDTAREGGALVISAPVYAELVAAPGRSETFVDSFIDVTGVMVDWDLDEPVWRAAGQAFRSYAARRRKHLGAGPRRILADFLIGAHALQRGYPLLTLDEQLYRSAFPELRILTV